MPYFISVVLLFASCQAITNSDAQVTKSIKVLAPHTFQKELEGSKKGQLIDVRTPEEYAEGHLDNALNIDFQNSKFDEEINRLNKDIPLFVYCLAGSRSSQAAEIMRVKGFNEIYELKGGIMSWQKAGLQVITESEIPLAQGISNTEFSTLISQKEYVLVDYSARWCQPCKKMAPMLQQFAKKYHDNLVLVVIDADKNKQLIYQKGIEGIPYLELYRHGKVIWKHEGYIEESTLLSRYNYKTQYSR